MCLLLKRPRLEASCGDGYAEVPVCGKLRQENCYSLRPFCSELHTKFQSSLAYKDERLPLKEKKRNQILLKDTQITGLKDVRHGFEGDTCDKSGFLQAFLCHLLRLAGGQQNIRGGRLAHFSQQISRQMSRKSVPVTKRPTML